MRIKYTCPDCGGQAEFIRASHQKLDCYGAPVEPENDVEIQCLNGECRYIGLESEFTQKNQRYIEIGDAWRGSEVNVVEVCGFTLKPHKCFQATGKVYGAIEILGIYSMPVPDDGSTVIVVMVRTDRRLVAVVELDTFQEELAKGQWFEIDNCGNPQ